MEEIKTENVESLIMVSTVAININKKKTLLRSINFSYFFRVNCKLVVSLVIRSDGLNELIDKGYV